MAVISQIKVSTTTYDLKDTEGRKEAYLEWGGKNFTGGYGCIDAAMVDELGANRLMFAKAAGITITYSRDNGSTWTDYGATDTQKTGLFSSGSSFALGKADSTNKATANGTNYQLQVTLATGAASIYTTLNKFVLYVSTNGSNNCTVTIDKALESTPTTWVNVATDVPLTGWSGYNVINVAGITTYGNTAASQYGRIRFTFKANGGSTSYNGFQVSKIMGFGGVGWTTPSTMAKTGHLYSYDANQNATFPANVTASNITAATITATTNFASPYFDASGSAAPTAGKLSGLTTAHSRLYGNALYISNPGTTNDQGWIRITGTGESDMVMEIATGDDAGAGEQIVVRQYNTSNAVARELILLDTSGNTSVPGQFTAPSGSIWAGTADNTTAERDLGVRSGSGSLYLYSQASATGSRGLYIPAHGSGSAKSIISIDTNNNATFSGALSGNATSATYANYPTGFSSRSTNATWGDQTGTTVTVWNEADGGSIDFRKNNPSSGKISIKIDGRFYFNEGATPAAGLKSANGYWGMTGADGEDNVWIRTTSLGIIPYQSGAKGSGHQSLGTSSWYFSGAYIDNIYTNSGDVGFKCRNISFGTSAPSGGANGDVYIQY